MTNEQLAAYCNKFETDYVRLVYEMMRTKLFLPMALELNRINVKFQTNSTFALKSFTFGYYNPVDNSICINIEDPFFVSSASHEEKINKLFFILFHEVMHKMLMHPDRMNNRLQSLWNIACDYEIHNALYIYKESNKFDTANHAIMEDSLNACDHLVFNHSGKESPENPKFLFEKKYLEKIAEEIYTLIENSKEEESQTMDLKLSDFTGDGSGDNGSSDSDSEDGEEKESDINVKVTKTTYTLPDGSKHTVTEIDWPEEHKLPEKYKKSEEKKSQDKQNESMIRSLMENQLQEIAKNKGAMSADCAKFLKKLFHVKVDWVKILRNSLQTVLEKSDYFAWNKVRTSTFLLPGMPYLPDIVEDQEKYGTLIISRDESGSMSDDEIAKAGGIIKDAKAFYKKIVLIKHDHTITKVYEFEEITDDVIEILVKRERCGGTSHKEVFEYLRDYRKNNRGEIISCYIGITDMESDIEEYQKLIPSEIPTIYLAPANIDRDWHEIKGKVIPIEL
jgi:predicted metal-dependent peptidase